jgi:hypothetical protein
MIQKMIGYGLRAGLFNRRVVLRSAWYYLSFVFVCSMGSIATMTSVSWSFFHLVATLLTLLFSLSSFRED